MTRIRMKIHEYTSAGVDPCINENGGNHNFLRLASLAPDLHGHAGESWKRKKKPVLQNNHQFKVNFVQEEEKPSAKEIKNFYDNLKKLII